MATRKAIDLVKKSSSSSSSTETLLLRCHVRPGASKVREGVTAITDDAVELCVAAQAQDGKANRAVVEILSEVRCCVVFLLLGSEFFSFCFFGVETQPLSPPLLTGSVG